MTFQKNDFIEIEFTGKIKDSEVVFDSNTAEELKKIHAGHNHPVETKPFVFALGQDMFLSGVDNFLLKQNPQKFPAEYKIDLASENAFGKRNSKLVQLMPIRVFHEQRLNPVPGIPFNFDGRIGKVLSVSGGRVIVDFNNPLAGKDVVYEIKILRKVDDLNEKISAFLDFLFRTDIKFAVENKKLVLEMDKSLKPFAEMFKDKFKEIFDLELEVKEIEKKNIKEKVNK